VKYGVSCLSAVAIFAFAALLSAQEKQGPTHPGGKATFTVVEASIPEMRAAMEQGRVTSRELVLQYLARIGMYENVLRATITVNPHALEEADRLDRERAEGRIRGPLHGIPIALKDNILTKGIVTTGGMLAFEGYIPPYDATLVKNLRDAGAIILAKTNLSELAGWIVAPPMSAPGNYTGVHGYGYNPYDPRKDPRPGFNDGRPALNTGGSSSGAGTTASFWAANIGTETGGSILNPSNMNMLVGIKPTVGRTSRYGVIPITADQDSAGPMGRTMTDAAIMLGAMESSAPDPNDPATNNCTPPNKDYTQFLKVDGLKGMRIGIPRAFYFDAIHIPGLNPTRGRGLNADQAKLMEEVIEVLKQQGAIVVDPANIPTVLEKDPAKNITLWQDCRQPKGRDADCSAVFKYGMKRDFNKWLATLGPTAPVKTLTELRIWNMNHLAGGAIRYGQGTLDASDDQDLEADRPRYLADRARDLDLSKAHGIDAVMKQYNLDAIMFPGTSGTAIVDRAGYPALVVPFGMIPNVPQANQNNPAAPPFPPGFNPKPAPYGVSFAGLACSEPKLIQIGYAFEQATKRRVPPASTP
jgi:amidase